MQKGFWGNLQFPIVGLSPMDGVTDAPWRYIAKKYGRPDVIYTEFVSVEGLWRIHKRGEMNHRIWKELAYDEVERPIVAQIFGSDPDSFYEATKIVAKMGFDGIDINMGCPSPGLERSGGGAGLIRDPGRARAVVEATRRAVQDLRMNIPVSLKTRLGSKEPEEKWWKFLATLEMPLIAMHGRTFKQLYSGKADWSLLFAAAEIIRESGTLFLANGDVKSIRMDDEDGTCVVTLNNDRDVQLDKRVDGLLIGKGAMGNPWVLRKDTYIPSKEEKLDVAYEHALRHEKFFGDAGFVSVRKHLSWYVHGFPEAGEIRRELVTAKNAEEVKVIVEKWRNKN